MNDLFNLDTWSTEYTALILILNLQKKKKTNEKKPRRWKYVKICHQFIVWNTSYGKCTII